MVKRTGGIDSHVERVGTLAVCLRGAYLPIKLSSTCIEGLDKSGRKDLKFLNK